MDTDNVILMHAKRGLCLHWNIF